jgi:Sec7-like guanine-nucleotide exchange factor
MTTTWNIIKLICKTENSLSNIVYRVRWECKKQDSSGTFVKEEGLCKLTQPDPNKFTQFENLTKTEVVSWVHSALGVDRITEVESRLETQLTEKLNTVLLDPPFVN